MRSEHASLDGRLLKLCKLHVDWMFECVKGEREECAKIADEIAESELKDQGYEGEHLFAHGAAWKVAQRIRARNNE